MRVRSFGSLRALDHGAVHVVQPTPPERPHSKSSPEVLRVAWEVRAGEAGAARTISTRSPDYSAGTRETRKPSVVTAPGPVVVAERRPAAPRRVVPATAADHAVRAPGRTPGSSTGEFA